MIACSAKPKLTAEQIRCSNLSTEGPPIPGYWECIEILPVNMRAKLCTLHHGKDTLFIGSPECYETLPQVPISGYWLYGFEHSTFSRDRTQLRGGPNPGGAWLELANGAETGFVDPPRDGRLRLYKVEFIGAESNAPGSYQYFYATGAYVHRFTKVEEIPFGTVDPK